MHRRLFLPCILATLAFLPATGLEAGSRRDAAVNSANAAKEEFAARSDSGQSTVVVGQSSQVTTRKLRATVTEPGGDDGMVAVEGDRWIDGSDKHWNARLDLSESEIVAKRRGDFDGRRQLVPADLAPGHELMLTVEIPSMEILKAKVNR